MARRGQAAWALARAGLCEAALKAMECLLQDRPEKPLALSRDAFVLLSLCEPGMPAAADASGLASKLWDSIDRHGRVTTWCPPPAPADTEDAEAGVEPEESVDPEELQNYTPGQVLLALAAAARTSPFPAD